MKTRTSNNLSVHNILLLSRVYVHSSISDIPCCCILLGLELLESDDTTENSTYFHEQKT